MSVDLFVNSTKCWQDDVLFLFGLKGSFINKLFSLEKLHAAKLHVNSAMKPISDKICQHSAEKKIDVKLECGLINLCSLMDLKFRSH